MSGETIHANENRESNLLRGMVPKTNVPIYFTEEEVEGKGDCGFITLGKERSDVADTLLALSSDENARAQLWEEIYESLVTNALRRPVLFDSLYRAYQEPNISEDVREEIRKVIEKYCKREVIYKAYVNAYREKLWLGYKSALLYAKQKNMTVYVWKKEGSNKINVIDSFVCESASTVIHMLLTQGCSHYNLLVETQAPALANQESRGGEVEIQKIPYLDREHEGHQAFAKRVTALSEGDIAALFAESPKSKKSYAGLTALKRSFKIGQEYKARSEEARELFDELSGRLLSLFPNLRVPLLNEELRALVYAGKAMAKKLQPRSKEPKQVRLMIGTEVVRPGEEILLNPQKKDSPIETSESSPLTKAKPQRLDNRRYENIYPIIDAVEKPILEAVKRFGYSKVDKKDDLRKLVKEDGTAINITREGEMHTWVADTGEADSTARECAKTYISMIMVYHEIAKRYGKELAFPSNGLDLTMNGNLKDNKEVSRLTKMYVARELAKPTLYWISDQFSYHGEKFHITPESDLNKENSGESLTMKSSVEDEKSTKSPKFAKTLNEVKSRESGAKREESKQGNNAPQAAPVKPLKFRGQK